MKGEARRTVKSPQWENVCRLHREKENTSQVWHLTSKCLKETDGLWLDEEESEAVELRGKTNWSCLGLWGQTIKVENFTLGLEHLVKTSADDWWLRRSVRKLLMELFVYKTTLWKFDAFRSERCSFASNTPHDTSRDSVCSDTMFFHCFSFSMSDENQKTLMSCPASRESAVRLVAAEHAGVRRECLALLSLFSETPRGRSLAIDSLDVQT